MPRFALALTLLAGCFFDADYHAAHVTCSDGKCPSGFSCSAAKVCMAPGDGGIDGHDAPDARPPALTCADPGLATGTEMGTTMGRANTVSSLCGGIVYNAPDAVYRIDGPGQVTISIAGSFAVAAYVIAPCTLAPQTPSCETNTAAQPASPLVLTLTAGTHYVVVDGVNAGLSGTYTLTVAR